MSSEVSFLFSGVIFGLSAGISPGPLLTLVVSETLRYNVAEGIKVSVSPLITDLPIIIFTLFALIHVSDTLPFLGMISIAGAAFIAFMGYESICFKGAELHIGDSPPHSIRKGAVANLLNPSPYLFWFSIGGPILGSALKLSLISVAFFITAFYVCLIGSKIGIAMAVARSRSFLNNKHYIYTIKFLGVILFVFAYIFLKNGLTHLGVL
ncbi:hypothetical protein DENIS_1160 [Desulfonema ishimotonii]|uniref:LysE family translocator n=1 Tax=Desulfonema ishimotonii TaxID=45657 RepID=A0A401FTB7_9BACT|nr:LysE family transporter [Desulfonema ishimotonii]GBC60209.1 hypothetical protein DENIS_1160 [Desulfonema ishimotonii]